MTLFINLSEVDAKTVRIVVEGEPLDVVAGQPLATALLVAGRLKLRDSPAGQAPRGAFCLMGVCQECAILVDGVLRQACMIPVENGMTVALRGVP